MGDVIVNIAPHYIFKRKTTLMAEIITGKQFHNRCDRECLLRGHHRLALVGIGGVNADRDMHLRFFKQFPELRKFPDRRHRNALRAPGKTPGRGQNLDDLFTSLKLSSGSPIPIKTILVNGVMGSYPFWGAGGMLRTWLIICEAVRFALNPMRPVAQK